MKRPIFKPHLHVEPIRDEGVFLLTENSHFVLTGRIYEQVAPLINGERSPDDIVDALSDRVSPAKVYYALSMLEKKGYIMENHPGIPKGTLAFWTAADKDIADVNTRLDSCCVMVEALGDVDAEAFVAALSVMGVRTGPDGEFLVVLTDDYQRPGLEEINAKALGNSKPWMLVKPVGQEIFMGPVFSPGKTGCWQCLDSRYKVNRETERFVMEKMGRTDPLPVFKAHCSATLAVAYNMAAVEIARRMVDAERPDLEGKIISLDTTTWQSTTHVLTARPQCPACGEKDFLARQKEPRPVQLKSDTVTYIEDGGHRTMTPARTLEKYDHLVSPITGVVNLLQRDENLGSQVHVYLAGQNFAVQHDSLRSLKSGLRNMSAGKGMSRDQARASGLCEAVERNSGLFQGYEPRIWTGFEVLGHKAIHPNDCMMYSQAQFQDREAINSKKSTFNRVPEPFEDQPMDWSPVWSLTREDFRYLPTGYLYYHYHLPNGKRGPQYFHACSNGAASGNTLEEAVLQGFFELVERDCVALWWYNMLQKPAVDLDSFNEPYFRELVQYYAGLDREVWVLDITSDLDIPAFVAISKQNGRDQEHIILGFGCHLDARSAVQRALTEMNQSLPHVLNVFGPGGDKEPFTDNEALDFWRTKTCESDPYLAPAPNLPVKKRQDFPEGRFNDILEEINICRKKVEDKGMEMLVLDQTRPDIGVPVAKVFVPGLRHFWARFAPGRLYEVPVEAGWLERPLKESQLNSTPIFF